jgi:hypothetical protein
MVLVSNSSRKKIMKDLELLPMLSFERIYSSENGTKPNISYLDDILKDQHWESSYLIGNDFIEDYSKHPLVQSIILPQPKLLNNPSNF